MVSDSNIIPTTPTLASYTVLHISILNTLRLRQNGRHFPDGIFKCIFLNENVEISIKISLKFVCKGPISNIPALVLIMARCWSGDKPLFEAMMVSVLTHICITLPQRVKQLGHFLKNLVVLSASFVHITVTILYEIKPI